MRTCEVCLKKRPDSRYMYAHHNRDGIHKWCDYCRIEYNRDYMIKTGRALPKPEPEVKEKTVRIRQKRVKVESEKKPPTVPVIESSAVIEWSVNHDVTFD